MRISDWSSDVCSSDLCRRGHITKHEVGAIRIFDRETRFEIPSAIAGKFVAALKRTGESDDGVAIEPLPQGAGLPPRQHRPKPGPDRFRPTGLGGASCRDRVGQYV